MNQNLDQLPTAGLIRRLMAIVYDSLLLLGVAFAYGVVVWGVRKVAGQNTLEPLRGIAATIELLVLWGVLAGYYVLCWTKRGQTLGMKSWRLQVTDRSGHYLSAKTAWLRTLAALLSVLPLALGYLWCLFDRKRGCWHDAMTGTRVTVLPKK